MATIAVAGKGGVGKTTFAALLIKYICDNHLGVVLAIDADPSSNLNLALGMPLEDTVGDVREEMLATVKGNMGGGIAKQDYLDLRINEALVEGKGVDLLAMGRPEGPGCYCAANTMLRRCVDQLSGSYDFIMIDNEAGLEHLSRRTTQDVDLLFVVSDLSLRGLTAAQRVVDLIKELKTRVGRVYLVLNRASGELPPAIKETAERVGAPLAGVLPEDHLVAEYDAEGRPLVGLPAESATYKAVAAIAEAVGLRDLRSVLSGRH
ncbi:MAG: AAA family ATPase [Bacteroidetes bacterium]|nr:AAA family ATPase [Bacteroidota bacterium]MCL5026526.1 AAA family ATPase [Chloroflexota bacterium]